MDDSILDELIDGYLSGRLSGDQLRVFEGMLGQDTSLQDKVTMRRLTLKALRAVNNEELKRKLKRHERAGKRKHMYRLAAAAVVLVGIAAVYFISLVGSPRPDLSQFDPYEEGVPNFMGVMDDPAFHEAMSAFRAGEYEQAVMLFGQMPPNDTIAYHEGVARYRMHEYGKALECIRQVPIGSSYYEKSQFRAVLIHLELSHYAQARKEMEAILQVPSHSFFDETKRLKLYIEEHQNKKGQ